MNLIHAKTLTHARPSDRRAAEPLSRACFWVRTAAGPSIGFGHLRRTLALASMLENVAEPCFLVDSDDFWTRREAGDRGWKCIEFRPDQPWNCSGSVPALILIDTRQEEGLLAMIREARRRGVGVASIHDLGLNPVPSDVGIDGSVSPDFGDNGPAKAYTGLRYLVLDSSYGVEARFPKLIRQKLQTIVVNLGGGDSSRYFLKVLKGLLLWDRDVEVVGIRGFVSWGQDQLRAGDWRPLRFRWAERDEPLPELLRNADLAITAGGLSAFEALCSGTPLMALSYDVHQHRTVSALAKAGLCVDLQCGETLEPQRIPSLVAALEKDQSLRQKMSLVGRRMVDGKGAERVRRILQRLMSAAAQK